MNKIIALFILIFMCSCISEKPGNGDFDLHEGDSLPKFSVLINDNSIVSNETLFGKPSLIVFFHTECPDCRKGFPAIQQVYEEFGDKMTFVAIGTGEEQTYVEDYWQKNGLTIPFSVQPNRDVFHLFASSTIPHLFIVDKVGLVRHIHTDNPVATYSQLKEEIGYIVEEL